MVPFGKTGGEIENGTANSNHAVAGGFEGPNSKKNAKLNVSLCGGKTTQTVYCLFDVVK